MRVSELLACCKNDLDRIVILDHGNIEPYHHKYTLDAAIYGHQPVKSFLFETINDGHKTTLFIELKGERKK